jgi:hypothetical protein
MPPSGPGIGSAAVLGCAAANHLGVAGRLSKAESVRQSEPPTILFRELNTAPQHYIADQDPWDRGLAGHHRRAVLGRTSLRRRVYESLFESSVGMAKD